MAFDDTSRRQQADAELVASYAAGDALAARQLADRVLPGTLALARRMLRNDAEAEDVAQETMLRLWKIAPKWDPSRAQVTTWTYRVAANLCTDRLRRSGRFVADDALAEAPDETPGAEQALMAGDRRAAMRDAIGRLPDRQRLAIQLRHFEELGNPQIAQIMETSVEAVESLLARAKRTLAAMLKPRQKEIGLK